ncbi:GNAT family protein [Maritalea porphyrae]|jgi:RimJ/RimL family protein N-acetyltransferase|uniref:GNAT family N-acetyltransferase n=1 Tax=Maritalea porphyrae TaxID=880732 RepID=UPI0022B01743|nr:GNAT family protein [Maritalea porphyrae]MCZ4272351.1 GNAT family protein [Maritalea porphyrae]
MSNWVEPITLEGQHVRLVPLSHNHLTDLQEAAADGELHRLWYTSVPSPDKMESEITRRLKLMAHGSMMPFSIIDKTTGLVVGMTTFMNIDSVNKRLEIGSTWYRKSVQRSPLNTECKILMLTHAFETLNAIAVEFRTHIMNHQSRNAIERLGAKLDGILRQHSVLPNGTVRDTAVYSIIPNEWPSVKANLQWKMDMPRN